nr:MAG TPA: hypothetical protein [Inoviridae sp.]
MLWYAIAGGVGGVILGTVWGLISTKKKIRKNFAEWVKLMDEKKTAGEPVVWTEEVEKFLSSKDIGKRNKDV